MSGFDPEFIKQLMADDEHGLLDVKPKAAPTTPEDRLRANFNEIVEFVREHGREPQKNPKDMTETRLAMRLKAIAGNEEQYEALREFDEMQLLVPPEPPENIEAALESDPFGLLGGATETDEEATDIFALKHVPEVAKSQTMPDLIAKRQPCADFAQFEPLFKQVHDDLRTGRRRLLPFKNPRQIEAGKFFVLNGMLVFVAELDQLEYNEIQKANARTRSIFENGTESSLLMQSLASNLYKDGRRVTEPNDETLERMGLDPDTKMGSIYVLRSLSTDPKIAPYPNLHKIGHTAQTVERRVAQAVKHATFLNAPVEIIAEYELPAVAAPKVEAMLHRFFASARLDIWFERDGFAVADANEWFDVPLPIIDEAIQLIQAETISIHAYNAETQAIVLS